MIGGMEPVIRQQCPGLSILGRCRNANLAINRSWHLNSQLQCHSKVPQRRRVRRLAPAAAATAAAAAVPAGFSNSAVAAFPALQAVLEPLLPYAMAAAAAYCALLMLLVSTRLLFG